MKYLYAFEYPNYTSLFLNISKSLLKCFVQKIMKIIIRKIPIHKRNSANILTIF